MNVSFMTPTGGWVRSTHHRHKAILQATRSQDRFTHIEVDMLIVSKARNELIAAIPENCEVGWFVDSDVLLPDNAGILLDYIQDYPVVSGVYHARSAPYLPQVYNRAAPGLANFAFLPVVDLPPEPFYADAVGAGCLLIRTSVLKDLKVAVDKEKALVSAWVEEQGDDLPIEIQRATERGNRLYPYFEFLERCGEDFFFCMQLQYYLGIRPYVVPMVNCAHETISQITHEHFEAAKASGAVRYSTDLAPGVLPS